MAKFFNPAAFEALQVRDLRLYLFGNTLSELGTQMQNVALAWQIYLLTGEPLSLGIIGLLRAGPALIFSIFGGALADAMSRRRLLLILQSVLLALSAILAILTLTGYIAVWLLYIITFLAAIAAALDGPAHAAVIPALVPRAMMTNAITLNNLSWSVAGVVGPALGGLVIGWFGVGTTYALNALSFLAVIWVLLIVRAPLLVPELAAHERGLVGSLRRIRSGWAFVRRNSILLNLMLLDFFAVLFGASLTLLPVFAKDVLKVGPEGLGLLAAAPALGSVAGAIALTLAHSPQHPGRVVLWCIGIYGVCCTVFGLSTSFWLSWLMLAGTGVSDTISMTMRQSIRQILTPEELRGRVGGISFTFAVSGTQFGEFEAGVAAQLLGGPFAVALGGLACVAMVAYVAASNTTIRNFVRRETSFEF